MTDQGIIVTSEDILQKLCVELKNEEFIAVDTEFYKQQQYYTKLCLIQIASSNIRCIIDALSNIQHYQPLIDIFLDKSITKIFHSPQQDLEAIYNSFNIIPDPIFDTQTAAMFCGLGNNLSYEKLVYTLLNVKLDKTHQLIDWSQRPMKTAQIKYAFNDVIFLYKIYKILHSKLQENGRIEWAKDIVIELQNHNKYCKNPKNAWMKINFKSQDKYYIQNIKILAEWREYTAQKNNIIKTKIMTDNILSEIALLDEFNIHTITSIFLLNKHKANKYWIEEIVPILQKQHNTDEIMNYDTNDNNPESINNITQLLQTKNNKHILSILLIIRDIICQEHYIDPSIVAKKHDINKALYYYQYLPEKLPTIPFISGWRYDVFGNYFESFLKGDIELSYQEGIIKINTDKTS